MEARNTEIAFRWTSDPTKADTDDDGANDRKERTDVGMESNDLPSNVKAPDVIHVFPATDEEFRDQHDNFDMTENGKTYTDYDGYVRRIFDNTNEYLKETFSNADANPHIVITTNEDGEWGEWSNEEGITPNEEIREMAVELRWPVAFDSEISPSIPTTVTNNRRGADVLSGFTGEAIGEVDLDGGVRDLVDDTSDGAWEPAEREDYPAQFDGGITVIGTNDIISETDDIDNLYLHEIGHVLSAVHPEDPGDGVPSGTEGVMCKYSCTINQNPEVPRLIDISNPEFDIARDLGSIFTDDWLYTTHKFSDQNRERMLSGSRNVTSVSTSDSDPAY